jgi:hypothetical protein
MSDDAYNPRPARRLFTYQIGRLVFFAQHADGEGWGYEMPPRRVRFAVRLMPDGIGVVLGEIFACVGWVRP